MQKFRFTLIDFIMAGVKMRLFVRFFVCGAD